MVRLSTTTALQPRPRMPWFRSHVQSQTEVYICLGQSFPQGVLAWAVRWDPMSFCSACSVEQTRNVCGSLWYCSSSVMLSPSPSPYANARTREWAASPRQIRWEWTYSGGVHTCLAVVDIIANIWQYQHSGNVFRNVCLDVSACADVSRLSL